MSVPTIPNTYSRTQTDLTNLVRDVRTNHKIKKGEGEVAELRGQVEDLQAQVAELKEGASASHCPQPHFPGRSTFEEG